MRAAITLANSHELLEVQQFWYRIYVAEMKRHAQDPLTDHESRTLGDPLIESGNLFLARDESMQIVATLMTTVAADADLGKYESLYGLEQLTPSQRQRTSITTKLMVEPSYRCTRLPMLMARATYEHALLLGVERDFIDCNDHLVSFFLRLGYRQHLGRVVHKDYGSVNSMVLHLRDAAHLKALGSPFYRSFCNLHTNTLADQEQAHVAA